MADTNAMLIIQNNMQDTFGLLFLILMLIYVVYAIVSVLLQKARIDDLKKLAEKIKERHEKAIHAKN